MKTTDDMDGVVKKCEGISVDLPISVEDADISFFDNIITLPLPVSAIDKDNNTIPLPCPINLVDKSNNEIALPYPLSAVGNIEDSTIPY